MEQTKVFNLEYYNGNIKVETLCYQKPKAICYSIMNEKATTTHKLGKFKLVK